MARVALTVLAAALALCAVAADRPAASSSAGAGVRLLRLGTFAQPTYLTSPPGDTARRFVTERAGRIRVVVGRRKLRTPFLDIASRVMTGGESGLLSMAFHPDYRRNRVFYVYYVDNSGALRVDRYRRSAGNANRAEAGSRRDVIRQPHPRFNHKGGQLQFGRDRMLYIGFGDGGGGDDPDDNAQNRRRLLGKLLRIDPRPRGGYGVPRDNPFVGREDARPEIWSYGHRNVQAAALHPETSQLWTVEHGAMGGDELNHPQPGRNYGWPVITYGVDYTGFKIGIGTAKEGMEQPVYYWDPVIAPSGALFYTGNAYPEWKGNLFIGSLTPGLLVRVDLKGGRVAREERYLALGERIRDVRQGLDGMIYLLTDSPEGRILKLVPTRSR